MDGTHRPEHPMESLPRKPDLSCGTQDSVQHRTTSPVVITVFTLGEPSSPDQFRDDQVKRRSKVRYDSFYSRKWSVPMMSISSISKDIYSNSNWYTDWVEVVCEDVHVYRTKQ